MSAHLPASPDTPPSTSALGDIGAYEDSLRLLERYQEHGEADALNALLERYYDRVRRIARIRTGPGLLRWTDPDDLVQDTFAVAFGKLDALEVRDHSSLIRYLARVLENQIRGAVDYHNASKRRGEPASLDDEHGPEPATRAPGPVEQLAAKELGRIYDECVEGLAADYREAVLLREYADASFEEVAQALGRPSAHAARLLYSRAQIELAARLRRRLGR